MMMMVMPVQIGAPPREDKTFLVTLQHGGKLPEQTLAQLGLKGFHAVDDPVAKAGLTLKQGCSEKDSQYLQKEIKLTVKKGTAKAVYLSVPPLALKAKTYVLLHVVSHDEEKKSAGGVTYILVNQKKD